MTERTYGDDGATLETVGAQVSKHSEVFGDIVLDMAAHIRELEAQRDQLLAALQQIADPNALPSRGDPTVLREHAQAAITATAAQHGALIDEGTSVTTNDRTEEVAQRLAELFDYPWEFMPEKGRDDFRGKARTIIAMIPSPGTQPTAEMIVSSRKPG